MRYNVFRMMRIVIILFISLTFVIAGDVGKISGKITDKRSGEPLAGANIILTHRWSGDQQMALENPMGAATGIDGSYYILNVDPGVYTLEVRYIGYTRYVKTKVDVFVDQTVFENIAMTVSALTGEAVIVESIRKNRVQTDLTATKQVYQISDVQSIAGVNDIGDIIALQADVVDDHFRGGRSGESLYILGGGTIVNPLNNSKAFSPIVTGLEQVEVYTSGFSAEYGNAQSGIINMVTKEGKSKWETRAEISYTAPYYKTWLETMDDDSNKSVVPGSPYDISAFDFWPLLSDTSEWLKENPTQPGRILYDPGYGFGPSYLQNRIVLPPNPLTYADSIQIARLGQISWYQSKRDLGYDYMGGLDNRVDFSTGGPIADNLYIFMASRQTTTFTKIPTPSPDMDRQLMGSLVYKPNTKDKLKLSLVHNVSQETYFSSSWRYWLFDPTLATSQRKSTSNQLGLEWRHIYSKSTFGNLKMNILKIEYNEDIPLLDEDDYAMDYLKMSNWVDYTDPANLRVGRMNDDSGDELTYTYSLSSDISTQVNQWNMIKAGAQFFYYDLDVLRKYNRYGDADIRILDFQVNPYEGAFFIQDKMEFEGMIANIGLRYDFYQLNHEYYSDLYSPLRNEDYDPSLPYIERGPYYSEELAGLEKTKFYSNIQPRLGLSFPINETTVFHLNYGTFTQRPNFNQLFYNKYNSNNEIDELGNPRLKPEETNAYDVGIVKGIPFLDLTLDVSAYYKDVKNLVQTAYFYDEQQSLYQTYINRDYADIKGFHINLEDKYGNLRGYIRYNFESATGKSSDALNAPVTFFELEDPTYGFAELPDPEDVHLDYDRTHKLVVNVRLRTPKGFGFSVFGLRPLAKLQVSGTYKYSTGRPYTDPETALLYTERTPGERDFRMRFEKSLRINKTDFTFYAEGYNLLNEFFWSYSRTFDNAYNTPRWKVDRDNILTYELYEPYTSSQEIYLLRNEPSHWRFGFVVKL